MASKETRLQRGRRRSGEQLARALEELRQARVAAGLSQAALASELAVDPSSIWRLEAGQVAQVTVQRLSEMASMLGLELSLRFYPIGDPVRDKGQLALGKRFSGLLSDRWRVTDETLLPGAGEERAWDKLLRLVGATPTYLVGVDLETRIRDIQALVRRTRGRERDGLVDAILLVVSDSVANRRLAEDLRTALGNAYLNDANEIVRQLKGGEPLVGSGVVLL